MSQLNEQQSWNLGCFLRDQSIIDPAALRQLLTLSKESEQPLYRILLEQEGVTEDLIQQTFARAYGLQMVLLGRDSDVSFDVLRAIPRKFISANRIIPFKLSGSRLSVAISEPENLNKISQLKLITEYDIEAFVCPVSHLDKWLEYIEDNTSTILASDLVSESMHVEEEEEDDEFAEEAGSSEVILFVNELIALAIEWRVSDIHIEPYKKNARVRYRMDGVLHDQAERKRFLWEHYSAIVTRIKIMAKLDIAERRLPQDGGITFKTAKGREVDLRVSVLPTGSGERVVMRILDHSAFELSLETLGLLPADETALKTAVDMPQGMVLVTGPTGSGKSTTLYACLNRINKEGINILTAEDPVEYVMEGVGQVQIRDAIGLTFSSALRSFLRQDPEVILVGEIRDKDTGDIAIKASLTGHLVLSTLHTNDAISTVTRLINMGVEPYLVVAALSLVVGQRLARKNCPDCSRPVASNSEQLRALGLDELEINDLHLYKGEGCKTCNGTGYKGRQGIYEVLQLTPKLKQAVLAGKDQIDLRDIAIAEGFTTMQTVGLDYVKSGVLSLDEYHRVLIF